MHTSRLVCRCNRSPVGGRAKRSSNDAVFGGAWVSSGDGTCSERDDITSDRFHDQVCGWRSGTRLRGGSASAAGLHSISVASASAPIVGTASRATLCTAGISAGRSVSRYVCAAGRAIGRVVGKQNQVASRCGVPKPQDFAGCDGLRSPASTRGSASREPKKERHGGTNARPGSDEAGPKSGVQDARFVRRARQKGSGLEHVRRTLA